MGFDININIQVGVDSETGLPYVWNETQTGNRKIPYSPEEFRVPKKYLKYLSLRGTQFSHYIKHMDDYLTETSVFDFLAFYPDWDPESMNEEGWSNVNHDEFKEALSWMASKEVFRISWSY